MFCALLCLGAADASVAQTPAVEPAVTKPTCCTIPALTVVDIDILDSLDSKSSKPGDFFRIRLTEPIQIDGRTLVPAGTEGVGQVVHAAKARAAGKAGELILAARYLDYRGTQVKLRSFRYGASTGKSNVDTAAVVGIAVATPLILVIAGGEIRVPAGTRANAKTAFETMLTTGEVPVTQPKQEERPQ